MANFTLHDLEKRVRERATASADVSYTRKLLDRGVAHCAKKLGEEAVETVHRRRQRGRQAPDRRGRRRALPSPGRAAGARHLARRGRGGAGRARSAKSGLEEKASRHAKLNATAWNSAPTTALSPYRTFTARRMGGAARRHADDADAGRGDAAALAARPARHEGGRGDLPAAVAAAVALCRGDAAAVPRAAALPRHRGQPRCPTSSASPARSRSASRPPRACCRRCSRAGRTCRRSISSPPTAFSFRTRCSSAKA